MATLCAHHHHKLSTTNRSKLIRELLQGQKFAKQLHFLLRHKPVEQQQQHESVSSPHQDLVVKILRSFTETLTVLTSCTITTHHSAAELGSHQHLNQLQLHPTNSCNDSPNCTDDRRSVDSGDSNKKRPASRDRRGCYKRKKNLQTWTIASSTIEDAHAWRKYGQKEILNAKYPRSYYRCTHKYDQGCKATKQVQRIENDPKMYETTYIGNHTCRDLHTAPKIITDSDHPWASGSYIVSSLSTSTPTRIVKQEYIKEETTSADEISDNLSSLDSVVWEDLMPFESSDAAGAMASDYGDAASNVYSCNKMSSSHSFDIDFDSEFRFDDTQFF